jgi:3-dehydroquinate dehydratase I
MKESMQGKICLSIAASTAAEAVAMGKRAEDVVDLIEIRLDALARPEVAPFFEGLKKPLLFTNRPVWEGGGWAGAEEKRVGVLLTALQAGAAYIDIELRAEPALQQRLLTAARETGAEVIVSWHDFKTTPSSQGLLTILQQQFRSGAQIGKIVTTAHDFRDVLRVLNLQVEAAEIGFPLIAFCMGRVGMISRLATLALNGYMSYGAPDEGAATAPGQLTVSVLRALKEKF